LLVDSFSLPPFVVCRKSIPLFSEKQHPLFGESKWNY